MKRVYKTTKKLSDGTEEQIVYTEKEWNALKRKKGLGSIVIFLMICWLVGSCVKNGKKSDGDNSSNRSLDTFENGSSANTENDSTLTDSNQIDKSEFVFWDSDRRYLSEEEIADLDLITIQTAINEIYARHGRKWDNEWDAYFRSKSWYNPQFTKDEFSTDVFSKIEKENIDLLAKYRDIKSGK